MRTDAVRADQFGSGLIKVKAHPGVMIATATSALEELAHRPQWVAWEHEPRSVRTTKVPYSPRRGCCADVTDPSQWATHEEARRFQLENGLAGVGFVFCADDPYAGVDLDHCRDPQTGELEPSAERIIRQLDSYTEVSPSGTGVKIWVRARLPGDRNRTGHIEIYDRARFFTVTGQHLPGTPTTIEDRQAQLDDLYRGLFCRAAVESPTGLELERLEAISGSLTAKLTGLPAAKATAGGVSTDEEVLRKAMSACKRRQVPRPVVWTVAVLPRVPVAIRGRLGAVPDAGLLD